MTPKPWTERGPVSPGSPEPPPDASEAHLTELTVNLVPAALTALERAADRMGDTQTETINRALQLYDAVTATGPGGVVEFEIEPGLMRTLVVKGS